MCIRDSLNVVYDVADEIDEIHPMSRVETKSTIAQIVLILFQIRRIVLYCYTEIYS